jgi:hypothetical protein
VIDLDRARVYLARVLDGEIEIKDEDILDEAAAVVASGSGATR